MKEGKRWWRKLLLGGGVFVLIVVLVVGGWIGANVLLRANQPRELWTEADMPSLPAKQDNGWETFHAEAPRLGRVDADVGGLIKSFAVSSHGSAQDAWKQLLASEQQVRDAVSEPAHRPWIELIGRSYAKPAFADACPIDIGSDCPWFMLFRAHQLAELAMCVHGIDGKWSDAFAGTERLARGDAALLRSARSLLAQMIALSAAQHTLELLELLLAGYEQAPRDDVGVAIETWKGLETALSVGRGELGMERALMGEYILFVRALDVLEKDPAKAGVTRWGSAGRIFFDRGETLALMNEDFAPLMDYAKKPGSPPPLRREFAKGALWWLRNPIGRLALDMGRSDAVRLLDQGRTKADDWVAKRDALVVEMTRVRSARPSP